jgi:hypothetical protein
MSRMRELTPWRTKHKRELKNADSNCYKCKKQCCVFRHQLLRRHRLSKTASATADLAKSGFRRLILSAPMVVTWNRSAAYVISADCLKLPGGQAPSAHAIFVGISSKNKLNFKLRDLSMRCSSVVKVGIATVGFKLPQKGIFRWFSCLVTNSFRNAAADNRYRSADVTTKLLAIFCFYFVPGGCAIIFTVTDDELILFKSKCMRSSAHKGVISYSNRRATS